MSHLEDEIRDLREKNSEFAKEVQTLRILTAQKDKENLELKKENNELRLKISRLRSGGAAAARKLDIGLQAASEEVLSHLVQASGTIARTIELTKQYMQERQELELASPQWSHISGSSGAKKINEVPPLLLGGQSIQPVVSLSRTIMNNRSMHRSPNQNSGVTHRAVPLHMLQDVYIPLTRIDAADIQANNIDQEDNVEGENSAEDLGLEDNPEQSAEAEESQNLSSANESEESHGLDAVIEESVELEDEEQTTPPRQNNRPNIVDNPLEGPSWLLDVGGASESITRAATRSNLEPDSTTPCDTPALPPLHDDDNEKDNASMSVTLGLAFTPTVRRRKRATAPPPRPSFSPPRPSCSPQRQPFTPPKPSCSPQRQPFSPPRPFSPRPPRKYSMGRVLKVVVAKMRLSDEDPGGSGDPSPAKRPALVPSPKSPRPESSSRKSTEGRPPNSPLRPTVEERPDPTTNKEAGPSRASFDAPSPNGATDSAVIVCESHSQRVRSSRRDSLLSDSNSHCRSGRLDGSDSDGSAPDDHRRRRNRKQVSYKEKPLNRKLRR